MTKPNIIQTGQVFDVDEDGVVWICRSFVNVDTGEVHTTRVVYQMDDQTETIDQLETDF